MAPEPNVTLSGNSEICSGTNGALTASGADTYLWNTGETTPNISIGPVASTVYTVTGTNTVTGCSQTETLAVQVSSYPQMTVTGTTFCEGKTGIISAEGATNYLWSNGSTQPSIQVTAAANTIYSVSGTATSTLCVAMNTVLVEVVPIPTLSVKNSTINLCRNNPAELVAAGATNYLWSTGLTTASISVSPLSTSVYSVSTSSGSTGCIGTKTIQVNVIDLPHILISGDSTLCEGQMTTLTASGGNSYVWNTGATTSEINVMMNPQVTEFYVTGKNDKTGCSATDSIRVKESPACCELWVPNAFSPNGDNMNEEFATKTLCEFKEYTMYVFNKWGEQIWSTSDVNEKWNGYSKGQACKPDVYVYLIRATRLIPNLVSIERTGHIALIK
ncbi:MAG: hypothetical protein K0S32_4598 [Bacteroidetes bacterium]|nr:hypothetical protein [Bacteroidota bacterium]